MFVFGGVCVQCAVFCVDRGLHGDRLTEGKRRAGTAVGEGVASRESWRPEELRSPSVSQSAD